MKGHIRERSPGKWAIILEQHDPRPANANASGTASKGTKRAGASRVRTPDIGNEGRDVSRTEQDDGCAISGALA